LGVCFKRVLSLLLPSLDLHRWTRPSVRCARQSSNLSPSKSKALDAKDKAARRRAEKDAAAAQLQGKRAQLSKVKVRPSRFLSVARLRCNLALQALGSSPLTISHPFRSARLDRHRRPTR
jgi:hypothetical protein